MPCPVCSGQEMHPYRTPQAIALATQLQRSVLSAIDQQPVLDWIAQWKAAYGLSIMLDRRLPSDQAISISSSAQNLGNAILEVAEQIHAEVAMLDGVVMLVPPGHASPMEATYWSLARSDLPPVWYREQKTVISWDEGTPAREVLRDFNSRFPMSGFQSEDFEHDVWRADAWEQTTPLVVAIALLSEFDLRPYKTEQGISIMPLVEQNVDPASSVPESFVWEYADEIPRLGKERWQQWRQRWPDVEVKRVDKNGRERWAIAAPATAHRELVFPLAPPPKAVAPSERSATRYTGRYRGELQAILKSLASQKQLELELPDLPPSTLRKELDLAFEQATFEELLNRIGTESGLRLRSDGKRITVTLP